MKSLSKASATDYQMTKVSVWHIGQELVMEAGR